MVKYKVLSTKQLEPLLINRAKHHGIDITEHEFISVTPVTGKNKWDEIFGWIEGGQEYVAFTSSNAVNAVKKYLHPYINFEEIRWKIFCLSGKTKETIENSFDLAGRVVDTADNASELAEKIIQHGAKEVIFFCGDKRRDELPAILTKYGITVHEVIVYTTTETPVAVTGDFDAVLFFSPSAVRSFFLKNQLKTSTVCFAIGQTTADSIADYCDNSIVISESPGQEMMLSVLELYFKKIK